MNFTETELGVISNALRVAAERFREHHLAGTPSDGDKLSEHFGRQADEAEALYQRIANEKGVQS